MLNPSDLGLPPKFVSYRSEVKQEETILTLAKSRKRFSLLNAPPGAGKSPVYISISRLLGLRTLILVGTKNLEDQLMSDFSSMGLFDIRGHSNYSCASKSFDDFGELFDFECIAKSQGQECGYRQDIEVANSRDMVETNNAHWFQLAKSEDPLRLGKFDLLIIDEAHSIHNDLVEAATIKLFRSVFSRFIESTPALQDSAEKWVSWAKELEPKVLRKYKEYCESGGVSKKEILSIQNLLRSLQRIIVEVNGKEWIIQATVRGYSFTPIWGKKHAEKFLFRGIKKVILVSGTINEDTAEELGLPENDYDYLEVGSSFPVERRPFYFLPTCFVDYRLQEGELRMLVNRIDAIASRRSNLNGIIQSVSYDWAEKIYERSKMKDYLLLQTRNNRHVITDIINGKLITPRLLLSPIVEQGYDFAGDACRYQIILKIPRVDSRDPVIAARAKQKKGYLESLAADRIEQMYGRPNRSKKDWSETFILDSYWGRVKNNKRFHQWFRDAWKQIDSIPDPLNLS